MNFYKHHIGDYAQATAHLSFVEDAAYSRMLRKYYAEEAPLPADVAKMIRLVGARTREEKQAVQTILDEFFTLEADGWHNKRADEELAKAGAQAETNRRIAEEREARKRARTVEQESTNRATNRCYNEHESLNESLNESSASREPSQTPDSRLQTPINLEPPPSEPPAKPSVPDCPQAEILALYAKHLPMLRQPRVWEGARADKLRTRWRYCAKPNGIGSGYRTQGEGIAFWEQFFSFVAQSKKLTEGIRYEDGTRWKPDLPWLLEPENFAKVVEGKFHEDPRA